MLWEMNLIDLLRIQVSKGFIPTYPDQGDKGVPIDASKKWGQSNSSVGGYEKFPPTQNVFYGSRLLPISVRRKLVFYIKFRPKAA